MAKEVPTLDTISGKVGLVPAVYLTIAPFKDHLVEVEPGEKDRTPALYKPTDVAGHNDKSTTQKKLNDKKEDSEKKEPTLDFDLS